MKTKLLCGMAAAVMGPGLKLSTPSEGRVDLTTLDRGVVRINETALNELNLLGDLIVATIHDGTVCNKGASVAGMRIIPLCIREEKLARLEEIARHNRPVVGVAPVQAQQSRSGHHRQ